MEKGLLLSLVFVVATVAPLPAQVSTLPAPTPTPTLAPTPRPPEVPRNPCGTVVVYELGKADNFALPTDPTSPSLALDALLQTGHPKDYDAPECDRSFGDSFKLDPCVFCCGICSATLEITLRGCGSALECNDYIYVGQAPFRGSGGYVLWEGYVNEPHCGGTTPGGPVLPPDLESSQTRQTGRRPQQSVVVKKIELDPRKVAELICRREIDTLDIHVQDDQIVDSVRLVITKP